MKTLIASTIIITLLGCSGNDHGPVKTPGVEPDPPACRLQRHSLAKLQSRNCMHRSGFPEHDARCHGGS